ncbi:nuclear transport factor 2 family protein [Pseudomonas oryzihabitans]|uniref:nuclear transport factor 2 family protein n=1 Tax=Pseudomonas oryzihabitans TaxID=47885 RepID=UPI00119CD96E|nr:nuclear transport factor 2 family protein [Pseudomonas oryzihabitans]
MHPEQETAQHIRELERQRYEAMVEGDCDAFRRLAHPCLLYIHTNGLVDTLDSYLEKLRSGYYDYHSIDHPIEHLEIDRLWAFVVGEMNCAMSVNGHAKTHHNRAAATWIHANGEWRLRSYQATPLK